MEKMMKTAKGLEGFFKVLFWVVVIGAAVAVVFSLAMGLAGENAYVRMDGTFGIDLGGVSVALGNNAPWPANIRAYWFVGSAIIAISALGYGYGLWVLRRMIHPMTEGRPFAESVSRDLHRLGWFSVVCGVVMAIFDQLGKRFLAKLLTDTEALGGMVTVNHEPDLSFFVIAALLFLFSFVFRYGHELQQLSDETL